MATYGQINQDAFRPDVNPADRNNYAIQAGYTGWDDYLNNANKIAQGSSTMTNAQVSGGMAGGGGTGANLGGMFGGAVNTPNLNDIYKNLYANSGIAALEAEMSAKTKAYNDAVSTINDNPFLAEASRVGRQQKLTTDFTNATANLKNDIQTKKADIEMQLNLQTKQFDINSQAAQQALSQFNTLLSAGALDNASASDIAAITQATGMSSSMIQSAIKASIDAKKKDIPTQTVSFDDGTNQGFAIINTQTGEIISKQTVAASKPPAAKQPSENEQKQYYMNMLRTDAANGATLSQVFSLYSGYLDADTIYQLYNANSKWGPDKGDISNLAKYGVTQPSY